LRWKRYVFWPLLGGFFVSVLAYDQSALPLPLTRSGVLRAERFARVNEFPGGRGLGELMRVAGEAAFQLKLEDGSYGYAANSPRSTTAAAGSRTCERSLALW
jgi:hypothetical protein